MASEIVRMAILAPGWLGYIRHDLHASRDDSSRASTTRCISRCRRSTESFGQLFHQSLPDIVSRNVDGIGNTEHDERALC